MQPDGKLARQQDRESAASVPAAAPSPCGTPADLLSTLANRQNEPVSLTIDEAAGVEMTRAWRDRAKDFESQNMTDGAVQFTWPAEIPSIVCAVLQVTDIALEPGEAITSVSTGDNLRLSIPVRDYGSVLPRLANFSINRIAELTPTAWAARI